MNTAWIARVVLAALMLYVAAFAVEHVRAWFERSRRWVWLSAMIAAVTLPIAAGILPQMMPAWGIESRNVELPPLSQPMPVIVPSRAPTVVDPTPPTSIRSSIAPAPSGAGLWVISSAVLLVVALGAAGRLAYRRRRAMRTSIDGVEVFVTPDLGPLVTGLFSPAILIPAWAAETNECERRLILAHEQQHIAGGDHWLVPFGALFVIAMPWNPVVWMIYARLRLAIETDCDARVIASGADRREYGTALIRVAGSSGPHNALSPAWSNRARQLEHRVRAMTASLPKARALRAVVMSLGATLFVAVALDAAAPDVADHSTGSTETFFDTPLDKLIPTSPREYRQHALTRGIDATKVAAPPAQVSDVGVIRVTGFTRDTVATRVSFEGTAGRFFVLNGQVLKATSDSAGIISVEFNTPAELVVRGVGRYLVAATSLETGASIEVAVRNPTKNVAGAITRLARGPRHIMAINGIDGDEPMTAGLRKMLAAKFDSLEMADRARNERQAAREATLEPGQIRLESRSGEVIPVVVRFSGGIGSISGASSSELGTGIVQVSTPVLIRVQPGESFGLSFSAIDSTQTLHAEARFQNGGGLEGNYLGAIVICARAGSGHGIGGGRWNASVDEGCHKLWGR